MGILNRAGLFTANRVVPWIKMSVDRKVTNIKAIVVDFAVTHPALAGFVALNAAALPVVFGGLSALKTGIYVVGSCPTMRNRLEEIKEEMKLPKKLDEKMGADLVDNITTPFGLELKKKLEDIAFNPSDNRINNVNVSVEDIEHAADKHALFELIAEIYNSNGQKAYERNAFKREYLARLAEEIKHHLLSNESITEAELIDQIKNIEVVPGKNIADAVVDWIERNKLFERDEPPPASSATNAPVRRDGFEFHDNQEPGGHKEGK